MEILDFKEFLLKNRPLGDISVCGTGFAFITAQLSISPSYFDLIFRKVKYLQLNS